MKTSQQWYHYFQTNLQQQRVDWNLSPNLSEAELATILKSLQAWQLGETSEGKNLLKAAGLYGEKTGNPFYLEAVKLFIKEEQKHGNNLGRYLDLIEQKRIKKNWGDTLFRKIRYFNASMELWTLAVITVESTAQIFYQSLKDATGCTLLQQICTDILVDEAAHISFQMERLAVIFESKSLTGKFFALHAYKYFYYTSALVVWMAHRKIFKAGNNDLRKFFRIIRFKFRKNIAKLNIEMNQTPLRQAIKYSR